MSLLTNTQARTTSFTVPKGLVKAHEKKHILHRTLQGRVAAVLLLLLLVQMQIDCLWAGMQQLHGLNEIE